LAKLIAASVGKFKDYRCLQRDAITFYRLATMEMRAQLGEVYAATLDARRALRQFVGRHGDALDLIETNRKLDNAWGMPVPGDLVFRDGAADARRAEIAALFRDAVRGEVEKLKKLDAFRAAGAKLFRVAAERWDGLTADDITNLASEKRRLDSAVFDFTAVGKLEAALGKLKDEVKEHGLTDLQRRNVLIRKLNADVAALSDRESALQDLAAIFGAQRQSEGYLRDVDCGEPDQRLVRAIKEWAADQKVPLATPVSATKEANVAGAGAPALSSVAEAGAFLREQHRGAVARFVDMPTAGQTLIVAMLFGGLGALCLQGLRLSSSGYWGSVSDPRWGEIVISLLLGMAAALVVYLLASMGMLLVTDGRTQGSQTSAVGASLVALLGFVSGLLNDDAFGRIRRFGTQLFRGDTSGASALGATMTDAEFVQRLRDMKCERFGELALIHRLGTTLVRKNPFTLFVPSDEVLEALTVKQWRALADPERPGPFNALLNRHLIETEALRFDQLARLPSVKSADGTALTVAKEDSGVTRIGTNMVLASDNDVEWRGSRMYAVKGLEVTPS
jgi:Fasciclin domain